MFQKYWNVLLVDDEPDVLTVSKLAMKNFEVFHLPIKIHTANNKKEAIDLVDNVFTTQDGLSTSLTVAFIDVVMESDTAGLELCRHIREDMDNYITQIYVRTGQPGIAPERQVTDEYEISGYISKVDATEDRLYSLVTSGVRQYYWSSISNWLSASISSLIEVAGSRYDVLACVHNTLTQLHSDKNGKPLPSVDLQIALLIDDALVEINLDKAEFYAEREQLKDVEPLLVAEEGDALITDYHNLLFKVVGLENRAAVECFARGTFGVPTFLITSMHVWLKCLGTIWKQSK